MIAPRPPGPRTAVALAGAVVAVLLVVGGGLPASADLAAGQTRIGEPVLSARQHRLVDDNPALAAVARDNPGALPALLEAIERLLPTAKGALAPGPDYPPKAAAMLGENPDLAAIYRQSPEAALDLLRLIREAAKAK